jgi:hypothetical protein
MGRHRPGVDGMTSDVLLLIAVAWTLMLTVLLIARGSIRALASPRGTSPSGP